MVSSLIIVVIVSHCHHLIHQYGPCLCYYHPSHPSTGHAFVAVPVTGHAFVDVIIVVIVILLSATASRMGEQG